jgi:two-component system sensor histidine kinase DesK
MTLVTTCWHSARGLERCAQMPPDPRPAAFPRRAATAVQLLSVLLALVEVGRLAVGADATAVVVGAVCAALVLPLHAQHLRYGLQGRRPPRASLTLGAMAAVHVAALALLGQDWAFMLAMLATSALVVLRAPWSVLMLAACCSAPFVLSLWGAEPSIFGDPVYLAYAVLFRSIIQFALVWLVPRRTARRGAGGAGRRGRRPGARRVEGEVRAAVEQRLELLVGTAGAARRALDGPDVAPPMVALDRVLALAADALADLRRIVSGPAPAPPAGAGAAAAAPGDGPTQSAARRFAVLVHAVVLPFPLAVLGLFGQPPGRIALAAVAWTLLVALEVRLAVMTSRGHRLTGRGTRALAAGAVGASGLSLLIGHSFETAHWIAAAIGLMAFSGRGRWVTIVVAALVPITAILVEPLPAIGLLGAVTANLWAAAYAGAVDVLAIGGLYAAARLVAQVGDLEDTRAALARNAVDTERRRLSGDLHDVLGQSLTALSLKADLARRLVHRDRARAAAELDGLLRLAVAQEAEVDAITRGARTVELAAEVRAAVGLLEAAGARVEWELRLDGLDGPTRTLLAWVVREGATNIVRHARPHRCTLRAGIDADRGAVVLELTNDGLGAPPEGPGGTGLRGLAGRLAVAGGVLHAGREPDGLFRLRAELPTLVPA